MMKRYYFQLLAFLLFTFVLATPRAEAACNAAFQYVSPNCPTFSFYDASTSNSGAVTQWSWTFGDGGTSTLQNPTHTYANNGTYQVCLVITTSFGCGSQYCATVNVTCIQTQCNAFFQPNLAGCPQVLFTDQSTPNNGISSWAWNFGDGGTSTAQNPAHTYLTNGSYVVCLTVTTPNQCTSTYCDTIAITCNQPTCQAGFQYTFTQCPTVAFTNLSTTTTGIITGYSWSFGDGGTSIISNPLHTYTANGTYQVCLTITTNTGCTNTYCTNVVINCIQSQCNAFFQPNTSGCPQILFTDQSTPLNGISAWSWTFGDGGTSTAQNPAHTYLTNGSYMVCLTVTTPNQCTSTYCDTISITCNQPNCQALFQYNAAQCPTVTFSNASTTNSGIITGYNWNFGDGGTSNISNPLHTYSANGTYQVCLTITTSTGCTNTYCTNVVINCIQPQCNAFFQPYMAGCPQILFTDLSTPGNGISTWSWTFGDGGTSNLQNPAHNYPVNGSYVVCLTITTPNQCTSTYCDTISITCNQPSCQAAFQYTLGNCPTVGFFDGSSTTSGIITGYYWTFGDGTTSPLNSPQHTYTANGTYQVCLSILTSTGCSSTFCDTISITCLQPNCTAAFQANLNGCPQIIFNDFSTPGGATITSWNWTFGDGSTSTAQNPVHTYLNNGNYVVCLNIVTSTGCQSTFCDTITINCNASCNAAFVANTTPNLFTSFSDQSTASPGIITQWFWSFGDGGTSNASNPGHLYPQAGTYVVCLTIITSTQCTDSICDTIHVGVTGIQEPQDLVGFAVFPNPFEGEFRVQYELLKPGTVVMSLFDIQGRLLLELDRSRRVPGKHALEFDASQLSKGMYMLRVQTDASVTCVPIMRR